MRTLERSYQATRRLDPPRAKGPKTGLFIKIGLYVLVLSILLWGWLKLTDPNTLPILSVKIKGNYAHIDQQTLQKIVMPFVSNGFFRIDVADLKSSLMQLPWIANVSIHRVWPDGLTIEITEQNPGARWGDVALLNEQGEVFNSGNMRDIPANLPLLTGPQNQSLQIWKTYQQIMELISPLNLKVVKLDLSSRQAWYAELSNGMTLILGRNDVLPRVQRFVQVYTKMFQDKDSQVAYVDLRYIKGMAVHWRTT